MCNERPLDSGAWLLYNGDKSNIRRFGGLGVSLPFRKCLICLVINIAPLDAIDSTNGSILTSAELDMTLPRSNTNQDLSASTPNVTKHDTTRHEDTPSFVSQFERIFSTFVAKRRHACHRQDDSIISSKRHAGHLPALYYNEHEGTPFTSC